MLTSSHEGNHDYERKQINGVDSMLVTVDTYAPAWEGVLSNSLGFIHNFSDTSWLNCNYENSPR